MQLCVWPCTTYKSSASLQELPTKGNLSVWYPCKHYLFCALHRDQRRETLAYIQYWTAAPLTVRHNCTLCCETAWWPCKSCTILLTTQQSMTLYQCVTVGAAITHSSNMADFMCWVWQSVVVFGNCLLLLELQPLCNAYNCGYSCKVIIPLVVWVTRIKCVCGLQICRL